MEKLSLLLLLLSAIIGIHAELPLCRKNEVFKKQGSDCPNCKNYAYVRCALQNVSKCYCEDGYVRLNSDPNSPCVRIKDCPTQCARNEEFKEQGSDCANCQNYLWVKCPPQNISKCYCDADSVRLGPEENSPCVRRELCPKCGEGQEIEPCQSCPPTCQNPNPPICYFFVCNPGCICKKGLIWDEKTRRCIPTEKCREVCGKDQVYLDCNPPCPESCNDLSAKECKKPNVCRPGCYCKKGLVRNPLNGKCVKPEDCAQLEAPAIQN